MGAMKAVALAAALLAAPFARADDVTRWRPYSAEASARFGVPLAWIERVIRLESGGQAIWRGRPITSAKGAMGLMQLMPGTWRDMRAAYGLGADPYDPHDNILAGAAFLRLMYDRFGYPGLFAAYNAGPGRYAAFLKGTPLPPETRSYWSAAADGVPEAARAMPRQDAIFALRAVPPANEEKPAPSLFAIKNR